ncbi:MAG: hypothetical protein J0G30_04565 [Actinomycetales bacterium]|nr:hypothetical protein [Actinomycetales bacterium]
MAKVTRDEPADETSAAETSAAETSAAEATTPAPVEATPAETGAVEEGTPAASDDSASDASTTEAAATPAEAAAASAPVAPNVVYVQTPAPPRKRGNRLVGVLLAVVGAVVFALLYAAVAALLISFQVTGSAFGTAFGQFLGSAFFWVPTFVFLIGFVLLVLLVNRSGWWSHVLGSLVVAVFVYFGAIGLILVVDLLQFASPDALGEKFRALVTNPLVIASAIVAREVSIWVGLAIAARGRRVKARNLEARAAFDRELAEKRAEHERAAAAAS